MKKGSARVISCVCVMIALSMLFSMLVYKQAEATSVSQIKIYTQNSYTGSQWRLAANSGETRNLKTAGCGLFAYAHAIEWLTVTKRGDDLLSELIGVCSDPNGIDIPIKT